MRQTLRSLGQLLSANYTALMARVDLGLGNVPNIDATQRGNHVGTQPAATISDLATWLANHLTSGANVSITPNPTTGVVTIAATSSGGGSATPGGTSGQIQINNNGLFGGSVVFQASNGNLGIGTTSPDSTLQIGAGNLPGCIRLNYVANGASTVTCFDGTSNYGISNDANVPANFIGFVGWYNGMAIRGSGSNAYPLFGLNTAGGGAYGVGHNQFNVQSDHTVTTWHNVLDSPDGSASFSGPVGFNGASPSGKVTLTGSRGGNAVVAALVNLVVGYGLAIDNTTA